MQDDSDFIRKYLTASDSQELRRQDIDWVVTFKAKSADISATLAAVERNGYIRENYSVWLGDLEFRRDQLDRIAQRTARAAEGKPRQTNVESYLKGIDQTVNLLDGLERQMKTRQPNLYYSEY